MKSKIENTLRKALLLNGEMSFGLFEHELEEHLNYWRNGMEIDEDEFLFVVTQNRGDVAILLMTRKNELFINEAARQKLQEIWKGDVYNYNIEFLLPVMTKQLKNDIISVNGVKTVGKFD